MSSTVTAITTYRKAESLEIGLPKQTLSVKQAIACLDSNFFKKFLHQLLCFFQGKGFVNSKYIAKRLEETDLPTLNKINHLFKTAKGLAEQNKGNLDQSDQKKDALFFLKFKEKLSKPFLNLLQKTYISKFTKDPELFDFCHSLPSERLQSIQKWAQTGITAEYLAKKYQKNPSDRPLDILKSLLTDESRFKEVNENLKHIYSPLKNLDFSLEELIKELNGGLLETYTSQDTSESLTGIHSLTISNTLLNVAFPPQTEEMLKKAFDDANTSHMVSLGYLPYFALEPKQIYPLIEGEPISIKLKHVSFISQQVVKTTFSVIKEEEDRSSIIREVTWLAYLNWPECGTPPFEEFQAFLKNEKELRQNKGGKVPLIIGKDNMAHVGMFVLAGYLKANEQEPLPIHSSIKKVAKTLGRTAIPKTPEEVAFIYASLQKPSLSVKEASLLNNTPTTQTFEELAAAIFTSFNPDEKATAKQVAEIISTLKILGITEKDIETPSEGILAAISTFYKNHIFWQELKPEVKKQIDRFGWTTVEELKALLIPKILTSAIEEHKKKHTATLKNLHTLLFPKDKGEASKTHKALLAKLLTSSTFAEKIEQTPAAYESLRNLLLYQISCVELISLFEQHQPALIEKLKIVNPAFFIDGDTNKNLDLWSIFQEERLFLAVLQTLKTLKEKSS
ncbi:hypothetical protein [Parachlamydia sp. AcF125]|uniref:hypothetical protein n=1 Tax=Parachlamydia sp. AcF125 TaxID=2795736 RepID=UPI001BC95DA7|nr:hypothetical protein [Parachlamydia sp. AcF125]MBS4169023.1 hypothetical protein [Parachlamydia sp. AcF125]